MYGYYFLASVGVKVPFKQIVTLSQMVQFLLFIAQARPSVTSHPFIEAAQPNLPVFEHWNRPNYSCAHIQCETNAIKLQAAAWQHLCLA